MDTLFAAVTDRQNSLTAVMDVAAGRAERYAYKPWGMRRDAEDWTKNVLSDHPSRFSRGYCMHEHLSEFGIIDMGGATAYIGGEIGGAISRVAGDWLSGIASPVLRNALPNMIGGGVSGFAVGAGFSLFGGASFKEAMSEGGKGAAFGAALGAISGTVKGIKEAKANNVSAWTGKSLETTGKLSYNEAVDAFGLGKTIERIEKGESLPHRNDGTVFRNQEGLLPLRPDNYYKEYVHPIKGGRFPGAHRIIKGQSGEFYYSPDHYHTFFELR